MISIPRRGSGAAIYSWAKKKAPISNRSQVNEDIVNETSSDIYERDSLRAEIYRLRLERDILEERFFRSLRECETIACKCFTSVL